MVLNDNDMSLKVKMCHDWISTQEHLPQKFDDTVLMRYIDASQGHVEKTKQLIDRSYTMRNRYPNIFMNRDPLSPESKLAFSLIDVFSLPKPNIDNYNLIFIRLSLGADINKINFTECITAAFMLLDIHSLTPFTNAGGIADGEVPVFDMAGITLKHLKVVVISSLIAALRYVQDNHCLRLKHIHVINCSPIIERIMNLVKPLLKKDIFDMIHFHTPDSTTLEPFVARDLLPNECGGSAGTIEEIKTYWFKKAVDNRDYLMDQNRWKINEQKRKEPLKPELSQGCFKSLEFD